MTVSPAVASGLVITALLLLLHALHLKAITQVGDLIFDAYQRQAPRPYQDAPIRIVDIDEESLARLGQWPWPRTEVAKLTQALADAGAASIAFDIVFSEPDRTSPARTAEILRQNPDATGNYDDIAKLADHDVVLGQTMARTPSVPGLFLTRDPNGVRPMEKAGFAFSGTPPISSITEFQGAIVPLPVIDQGAAGNGFVSITGNDSGIVRSTPLIARIGDRLVPSLSLEALRVAQGAGGYIVKSTDASGELGGSEPDVVAIKVGDFEVPTTPAGEIWMYYTAPHPERIVPAWKILTGALNPNELRELFEGRIVFIGTGAIGLRDLVATPISDGELGVVVHAQVAEQMILGKFLTKPDWATGLERFILFVLGVGISLLLPRLSSVSGGILAAFGFVGSVLGSWYAFRFGSLLLDPTYPAGGVIAVYIAGTSVSFYNEERARAYIRRAFDRYLSPELVESIARDPSRLELGGETRDMTVLFCDIRSFSRISEKLSAAEIIAFLIDFLTPMTDVLLARKATIDKYIGDAILAFWNAPLDDPEHPRNAAFAALDMVAKLNSLNANAQAQNAKWPGDVKIGIGLNTGPCCVGNIGSQQRLNYSLIGDTVNLASRIEGLTKAYGVSIAIGSETAKRIPDFALVELDLVRVVGRDTPERIYALAGPPGLAQDTKFQEFARMQADMLTAYRSMNWDRCEAQLESLQQHAPAFGCEALIAVYRSRIGAYRNHPPAPGWDGVFRATEK